VTVFPTIGSIIFSVGVLQSYLGSINIPADTSRFSWIGDYDLGHSILLSADRVIRSPLRALLENYATALAADVLQQIQEGGHPG